MEKNQVEKHIRNNGVEICGSYFILFFLIFILGTSLMVQWLSFQAPNAKDPGLIPGQGTGSPMQQLRVLMP